MFYKILALAAASSTWDLCQITLLAVSLANSALMQLSSVKSVRFPSLCLNGTESLALHIHEVTFFSYIRKLPLPLATTVIVTISTSAAG